MTLPRTAYTGRLITFATMHGKEFLTHTTHSETSSARR